MAAPTQGGATRLRRYAVPWAGIGLPFQGEELAGGSDAEMSVKGD